MSDQKTEKPTPRKLRDARRRGQVARSQDLSGLVVTASAMFCSVFLGGWAVARLIEVLSRVDQAVWRTSAPDLGLWATAMFVDGALIVLPVLVVAVFFGIAAGVLQVGFYVSIEPVLPNFDAINPIAGFKRIFSLRSLLEAGKAVAIVSILAFYIWVEGPEVVAQLLVLHRLDASQSLVVVGTLLWQVTQYILLLWLFFALLDWVIQKQLFLREQRMSKDDLKQEYKSNEGDPQIKGMRRQMAMEIANEDPKPAADVANASLMITNPTHLAIAVYHGPGAPVPIVAASGADERAAELRCKALEAGVAIVEEIPLARAMWALNLHDEILPEMYDSVIELMVWTENINEALAADV